jgi:FKBP-type peptidyl-prolyl cis-trans isomerase
MKKLILTVLGLSTALWLCAADEDPFKSKKERISYTLGMLYGKQLKQGEVEIDFDLYFKGLKDASTGGKLLLTEEQGKEIYQSFLQDLQVKRNEKLKAEVEKNQKDGETFLAENKKKEGVVTTASGLQYKIETKGTGKIPTSNDTVVCHYRGTLLDGTEFDNSYKRNQPGEFTVGGPRGVIKGWTEALLMMPVGSKWKLFIPSELAYGEAGNRRSAVAIPGNSTLQFDIELIDIKPPGEGAAAAKPPPGAPQKITLPTKPK